MKDKFERARDAEKYKRDHYDAKRTHEDMCYEYLELNGSISPLDALTAFNCWRLAAVIYRLRERGCVIRTDINEDGGKKYAIYTLMKEGEEYDA